MPEREMSDSQKAPDAMEGASVVIAGLESRSAAVRSTEVRMTGSGEGTRVS